MARSAFGRWPLLLGAALVLAACQESDRSGRVVGAGPNIAPAGATRAASGDVEAPDVFEKTENGLWDGRPSLGGIWVAHPDVAAPERVLIQNQANGKTIVGALFRRERANPGPRIQISSDAASELGILAGQPTMLRVVALKRREEAAPEPAPESATEPAPAAAGAAPAPAADDAAAIAAATGAALATTADGAEPQPVPEDRPPTSLGRRRDRQAPAEAAAVAGAAETGAPAETAPPPVEAAALPADATALEPQPVPEDRPPTSLGRRRDRQAAPAADAAAAPGGDISVAPLDATAAGAAAPAAGPAVRFPFIQAAAFGSEANANAAADRIRAAGIAAEIRRDGSVWRVLAGPVSSAAEQSSVLEKVKGLGYRDAYPVRG